MSGNRPQLEAIDFKSKEQFVKFQKDLDTIIDNFRIILVNDSIKNTKTTIISMAITAAETFKHKIAEADEKSRAWSKDYYDWPKAYKEAWHELQNDVIALRDKEVERKESPFAQAKAMAANARSFFTNKPPKTELSDAVKKLCQSVGVETPEWAAYNKKEASPTTPKNSGG